LGSIKIIALPIAKASTYLVLKQKLIANASMYDNSHCISVDRLARAITLSRIRCMLYYLRKYIKLIKMKPFIQQ
jgi:hypothetical protein